MPPFSAFWKQPSVSSVAGVAGGLRRLDVLEAGRGQLGGGAGPAGSIAASPIEWSSTSSGRWAACRRRRSRRSPSSRSERSTSPEPQAVSRAAVAATQRGDHYEAARGAPLGRGRVARAGVGVDDRTAAVRRPGCGLPADRGSASGVPCRGSCGSSCHSSMPHRRGAGRVGRPLAQRRVRRTAGRAGRSHRRARAGRGPGGDEVGPGPDAAWSWSAAGSSRWSPRPCAVRPAVLGGMRSSRRGVRPGARRRRPAGRRRRRTHAQVCACAQPVSRAAVRTGCRSGTVGGGPTRGRRSRSPARRGSSINGVTTSEKSRHAASQPIRASALERHDSSSRRAAPGPRPAARRSRRSWRPATIEAADLVQPARPVEAAARTGRPPPRPKAPGPDDGQRGESGRWSAMTPSRSTALVAQRVPGADDGVQPAGVIDRRQVERRPAGVHGPQRGPRPPRPATAAATDRHAGLSARRYVGGGGSAGKRVAGSSLRPTTPSFR